MAHDYRHDSNTAFLDIMLNMLFCFIVLFLIAILKMNPPESETSIKTEGEFMVVVTWHDDSDDDVDTYVMDPRGNVAYYKYKQVGLMHLERDDVGKRNDAIQSSGGMVQVNKNEERVILRGIVPGEYVVNVHMFAKRDLSETNVKIALYTLKGKDRKILEKERALRFGGEEKTAFRFTLNTEGEVSKVNELPRRFVYEGGDR